MAGNDLTTVVVSAFNLAQYLPAALESLLAQTHRHWEAIVVDDASTDRTWEVIRRFNEHDERIRGIRNADNLGAAETRNRALAEAAGRYVAFLDGDDIWERTKLERQLQLMRDTDARFVFGPYGCINEAGRQFRTVIDKRSPPSVGYKDMLAKKATLGCSTVLLDRAHLGEIRMPNIAQGQDYALWLKLLKRGISAHRLNDVCAYYRIRKQSISRNKIRKAKRQWEIYRKHEQLGLDASMIYFAQYAWRALFRV